MSDVSPLSNEELRSLITGEDPSQRVYAAFELGHRLGNGAVTALDLDSEQSPGVRMHWLTILASYGEHAAVIAIAEQRAASPEGVHAIHLAVQLGVANPTWLADRFVETSERCRITLVRQHATVDWNRAMKGLEQMLASDTKAIRVAAADLLHAHSSSLTEALKRYALTYASEAEVLLQKWATSGEHNSLLEQLHSDGGRESTALSALLKAGRRYPLSVIRRVLVDVPEAIALADVSSDRADVFAVVDATIQAGTWLSPAWISVLRDQAAPPFSTTELEHIRRWARMAVEGWWDDYDGPPLAGEVLNAMGCAVQHAEEGVLQDASILLFEELGSETPNLDRLGEAVKQLLRRARTERCGRPLAEVDGVQFLDSNLCGFATWGSTQYVVPVAVKRLHDDAVHLTFGDAGQRWTRDDFERLNRRGQLPAHSGAAEWEGFFGQEGYVLFPVVPAKGIEARR